MLTAACHSFPNGKGAVIASGRCLPPAVVFTWISALDARIGAASFTVQSTCSRAPIRSSS